MSDEKQDVAPVTWEVFEAATQFWLNVVRPPVQDDEFNTILENMKQGQILPRNQEFAVSFHREWDPWETTLGGFVDMMEECQTLKLTDYSICETTRAHYFHVQPVNLLAHLYVGLPHTFFPDFSEVLPLQPTEYETLHACESAQALTFRWEPSGCM